MSQDVLPEPTQPVSGTVTAVQSTPTNFKVDASGVAVPVTDNGGALTVDGTVAVTGTQTDALTDTQLRATPVVVDLGANNDVTVTSGTLTANAGTGTFSTGLDSAIGATNETAASTDTATSGLNGRLQRIAQRLTSLIALVPSALTGSGNFKVAVQEALPAGTNAIGKLAANSGVDIGDVDVTSVPVDPFGANADAASASGSISAKLRFIATTGIPVTGTVTVGSHAVTNAGTFAVQADGSVAHDSPDSGAPVKVGGYAKAAAPTDVSADGDRVNAWYLRNGAQATVVTAAGALIGGDAANGLDVDVTRVPAPLSTTGGGTEAAALRVTLATDSTGVVSVDDNGSSLTVDGAVTVTNATATNLKAEVVGTGTFAVQADTELTTADLDTGAGTDTRAVVGIVGAKSGGAQLIPGDATAGLKVDLGADNDVTVTSGTITTVSTVTTITNAVAVTDNAGSLTVDAPVGTPVFARLSDGSAALIGQKAMTASLPVVLASDQSALTVNSHAVTNAGTFAVQVDELNATASIANAALQNMTTVGAAVLGQFDDVSTTAVTENNLAPVRISSRRALLVEGVASGTALGVSLASGGVASGAIASGAIASGAVSSGAFASGAIGSGAVASGAFASGSIASGAIVDVTPGTGATHLGKAEDAGHTTGDVGVMALAVRSAAPTDRSAGATDGDYEPLQVDALGRLRSRTESPTATLANVAGSATSVTLIAANTSRVGATIWNDSTAILYVKFGTTASTTSATVKLIADAYYEVPFGYTGIITGIWASATGSARVTELT